MPTNQTRGRTKAILLLLAVVLFMGTGWRQLLVVCFDTSGKQHFEIAVDYHGTDGEPHRDVLTNIAVNTEDHSETHWHHSLSGYYLQRDGKGVDQRYSSIPVPIAVDLIIIPDYVAFATVHLLSVPPPARNISLDSLRTIVLLV